MREADQPQIKASSSLVPFNAMGSRKSRGRILLLSLALAFLNLCHKWSPYTFVYLNSATWSFGITSAPPALWKFTFSSTSSNQRCPRSLRIRRHQAPREVQSMELLSPAEVRHVHRAVRAKALEAIAVGNLPPGKELEAWILRDVQIIFMSSFLSNRFEHVQVCATRVALCLQE